MSTHDHWITLDEVLSVTGLARTTVYDLIREGDFPPQVKIGSASRWSANDVTDWMARKHAERPLLRAVGLQPKAENPPLARGQGRRIAGGRV